MTDLRTLPLHAGDLFTRRVHEYAECKPLQQLAVLEAGCGTGSGLDLGAMDRHVSGVDADTPTLRAHARARDDLDTYTLGDLRRVPLPPRAFDVVHAPFLIDRTSHTELVLDRILAAMKPGGLLLLRFRDSGCAYGFIDRLLPKWVRSLLWQRLGPTAAGADRATGRPEDPPHGVYEPVASYRGMQWYCVMRGLVILEEQTSRDSMVGFGRWSHLVGGLCRTICILSRGRLTAAHSEVSLVIRKPESRFARVL